MATSRDPVTRTGPRGSYYQRTTDTQSKGASAGAERRAMTNNRDGAPGRPHYGRRIIFTGPDGAGDYRPRFCDFPRYIGEGSVSAEATGDLSYLWRSAPHNPPSLRARDSYVGGVGWGWHYNRQLNQDVLLSDMQIKKTDIRAAVEDAVSQRFQASPPKKTAAQPQHEDQRTPPRHSGH